MNIFEKILTEEFEYFLKEVTAGEGDIQTFPYERIGEGRYRIRVSYPVREQVGWVEKIKRDSNRQPVRDYNGEIVKERKPKYRETGEVRTVPYVVNCRTTKNNDEKIMGISFDEEGGGYKNTNIDVKFKLMATITKIIKEEIQHTQPDIITFQPVGESSRSDVTENRRMKLYLDYVKGAAGDEYDAFTTKKGTHASVEKRNPSFGLKHDLDDPELAQEIFTDIFDYGGYYETSHLREDDPNYVKFGSSGYGFYKESPNNPDPNQRRRGTMSLRRLLDWMEDYPNLNFIYGRRDPNKIDLPQYTRGSSAQPQPQAPMSPIGTFGHFINTQAINNDDYNVLRPFMDGIKNIDDIQRKRTEISANLARTTDPNEIERLQEIVDAFDKLINAYDNYRQTHGINESLLNEIQEELENLLN